MSARDNPGYRQLVEAMRVAEDEWENAPDAELRAARMRRGMRESALRNTIRLKPDGTFPHPFEDWNSPEDSVYDD